MLHFSHPEIFQSLQKKSAQDHHFFTQKRREASQIKFLSTMAPKTPQVNPSLFGGAGEVATSGAVVVSVTSARKMKRLQKKSPVAETYKISNNPGTGTPPLRCSNRTKAGGGDPGEGTPRKKPRGESPRYVFWIDRLLVEVATKPPQEDTLSEDGDVEAGAYNKGSDEDEAAASAARRAPHGERHGRRPQGRGVCREAGAHSESGRTYDQSP